MEAGSRSFARDAAFFVALMATSFALGAALAHAFELPNKMGLGRDEYFVVQTIYAGWNRLAYVLAVELAGMLALIFLYRAEPRVFWPVCVALGGLGRRADRLSGSGPSRPIRRPRLDAPARELGSAAGPLGIFASGRGRVPDDRNGGSDCRGLRRGRDASFSIDDPIPASWRARGSRIRSRRHGNDSRRLRA